MGTVSVMSSHAALFLQSAVQLMHEPVHPAGDSDSLFF